MGYLSDALRANIYKTRVSFLFGLYNDFVFFLSQSISILSIETHRELCGLGYDTALCSDFFEH